MRIALICFLFFLSCSSEQKPPSLGHFYLPSNDQLSQGVVYKYYQTTYKENQTPKTNIVYHQYRTTDDTLSIVAFGADFKPTQLTNILVDSDHWQCIDEEIYSYYNRNKKFRDTINTVYDQRTFRNWSSTNGKSKKFNDFGWEKTEIIEQTSNKDSIAGGVHYKVMGRNSTITYVTKNGDTTSYQYQISEVYQEELGSIMKTIEADNYTTIYNIEELMTLGEFERRSQHGLHRVGYIDTMLVMDDASEFSPCFHPTKINDYYNDDDSGIIGGKGAIWQLLDDRLNQELIGDSNGYLTFRFVINCNGEAGWFITEQADLAYDRIAFPDKLLNHLFDILKSVEKWKSLSIRSTKADAFTYITFKFKDGQIIDILP